VEGKAVVQFIEFGNKETKEEKELYDISEEIGSEPAATVEVCMKNDFEETSDNRGLLEEIDGDKTCLLLWLRMELCSRSMEKRLCSTKLTLTPATSLLLARRWSP